jgi:hypothetical protein
MKTASPVSFHLGWTNAQGEDVKFKKKIKYLMVAGGKGARLNSRSVSIKWTVYSTRDSSS